VVPDLEATQLRSWIDSTSFAAAIGDSHRGLEANFANHRVPPSSGQTSPLSGGTCVWARRDGSEVVTLTAAPDTARRPTHDRRRDPTTWTSGVPPTVLTHLANTTSQVDRLTRLPGDGQSPPVAFSSSPLSPAGRGGGDAGALPRSAFV